MRKKFFAFRSAVYPTAILIGEPGETIAKTQSVNSKVELPEVSALICRYANNFETSGITSMRRQALASHIYLTSRRGVHYSRQRSLQPDLGSLKPKTKS